MSDEQNTAPEATTDPQGRLDALVSGIELCRHCGGNIALGQCIRCGKCNNCLDGGFDEHGWPVTAIRMIVCPECGDKRCPKASDHNLDCTGSNDHGQTGSVYR